MIRHEEEQEVSFNIGQDVPEPAPEMPVWKQTTIGIFGVLSILGLPAAIEFLGANVGDTTKR